MIDYRNNLKQILHKTAGDDQSLRNSLNAIKAIIGMSEDTLNEVSEKSTNKIILDKTDKKIIKQLFQTLAELIESPGDPTIKHYALSALHKLTFISDINKEFGLELGNLDKAIQSSTSTKSAINSKIFKEAIKTKEPKHDYRKGNRYVVIRLILGADLINDNGETVYFVKESQVHPLNLKTGDIVEAIENKNNSNYEAEILRIVGYKKLRKRDYDEISDFKYAVVQGKPGHFYITHNVNGQKLKVRGKNIVLPVSFNYYQKKDNNLEDGSIVDLAWYTGDVKVKKDPASAIVIRWIYQVDPPKHLLNVKKKKDNKGKNDSQTLVLDMNLHYKRVGVAIGNNQNEAIFDSIITHYNGISVPIDAFNGKKKLMEQQIKNLDIVILVTAFAAHDSTWNICKFASKYGVKFAVSSSKGYRSFERALYRASKGLPAYEGNQKIEYKTKK